MEVRDWDYRAEGDNDAWVGNDMWSNGNPLWASQLCGYVLNAGPLMKGKEIILADWLQNKDNLNLFQVH